MSAGPAELFHVVELFLMEKKDFTSVSVVDPTRMSEGYILGHGIQDGAPVCMRVSREDLEEFAKEMQAKQQSGEQTEASHDEPVTS